MDINECAHNECMFNSHVKQLIVCIRAQGDWLYISHVHNMNVMFFTCVWLFMCVSAEYQRLIEDIVQDGRLYSSFQHQSVLRVSILQAFSFHAYTVFFSINHVMKK